ncbi:MAG: PKD domain-containing protein [Tannerella sp.]|jgi:hypothetical protein|nr:PKD domain-containing protein [Tannerella sp.]
MGKISNTKIYITVTAILICVLIALLIRLFLMRREPAGFVTPLEVYEGEPVFYSDSTFRALHRLWEFGNGDASGEKQGEYIYHEAGAYRIRLSVNYTMHKEFLVNVRKHVRFDNDSLIRIVAPHTAMQGEFIVFRGVGYAKEWRWSFGETHLTDSREQAAIYAYENPGAYEVELMTEDTKYPVRHTISILPKYMEEETDERSMMGNDIREKLQAIVDGKPFGPNYNHILNKYLCQNPNVLITVNESKNNDFYSYCQGLKIIDRRVTTILEVIVFPDEQRPGCLKTFKVIQIKNEER